MCKAYDQEHIHSVVGMSTQYMSTERKLCKMVYGVDLSMCVRIMILNLTYNSYYYFYYYYYFSYYY